MGCLGSETAAAGSFFSSRQRCTMWARRSPVVSSSRSVYESVKKPTRWSARRVRIAGSGSGASV
jgi:hypothetical protein